MANCGDEVKSTSHKNETVKSYSLKFKLEVIGDAEKTTIGAASRKFSIDRKRVREWLKQKDAINEKLQATTGWSKKKRLDGGGRKLGDEEFENHVLEWIHSQRARNLRVSRKMIMKKAKLFAASKAEASGTESNFNASCGWLHSFMLRNGLSLRRRTTQAQKSPDKLIDKVIAYILYVRRLREQNNYDLGSIIAMDETPVFHDMLTNTTVTQKGAKSVVMKTTGHDKNRITVVLAAKANGEKCKPYVVFPGAKREVQNLKKDPDLRNLCFIESTPNGWMNELTTIDSIDKVLKTFNFGTKRLLAWDSYRAHLTHESKDLLRKGKIDQVIIPGGATGHIQAPDVCWNKP